jgi:hypothetical protein
VKPSPPTPPTVVEVKPGPCLTKRPPRSTPWQVRRSGCPEGLVCYAPADDMLRSDAEEDLWEYAWDAWHLCGPAVTP